MTTKRLIKIVLILAIAISITILANMRFPKYGNTEADIAHIANRNPWYKTLVVGSDVETFALFDLGTERIALVRPHDENDQQFAMVRFKKNQSDKYELRENGITWCPNNQIMVYRVEYEGKNYDICVYNHDDVVLLQRMDVSSFVQNFTVTSDQRIALWEVNGHGYKYNALTSSGVKLNQKW